MEDQIGALGLVLNALVLFNTRYMDAAVNRLHADGFDVRDEDFARLSPFVRHHINMHGRYSFQLPSCPTECARCGRRTPSTTSRPGAIEEPDLLPGNLGFVQLDASGRRMTKCHCPSCSPVCCRSGSAAYSALHAAWFPT